MSAIAAITGTVADKVPSGVRRRFERPEHGSERKLEGQEKRTLALLGLPTFGLALSITVVTTYLPVLAKHFTGSTTVIGLIVGGEGALALFLPLVVGTWSDQLRTRLGGRLPFLLGAAPLVGVALAFMGFVGSLLAIALVVLAFFAAYYVAYEPYRALYPDLVPDDVAGRGQSTQALWRGAGTGLALVGGGLLLSIAQPLPFLVAAGLMLVAVAGFGYALARQGIPRKDDVETKTVRAAGRDLRRLLVEHPVLRHFLVANALWELSLSALKTFIVLYITAGLGLGLKTAVGLIAGVAVIILLAAPVSGALGDRLGKGRVMTWALVVYGLGLLAPFFTHSPWVLGPVLPVIAFGGAVIMTLPYALLIPMMPKRSHGSMTGYYSLSRGIGTMLGPLLAGGAVSLLRGPLASTHGYAAMWLVCSVAILASIPFLLRLRANNDDRATLREA